MTKKASRDTHRLRCNTARKIKLRKRQNKKLLEKVVAADFEPIDFGDMTQFSNDTFQKIGIAVRVSAVMLSGTKEKMVELAKSRGVDDWFEFLEQLDGGAKDLEGLREILTMAFARGLVVAGTIGKEEASHA